MYCPNNHKLHILPALTREDNLLLQALHHVGDAFETIAKSFHTLAASVVDLKGAIQVSLLHVMTDYSLESTRESGVPGAHLMHVRDFVLCSH